MVTSQKKSRLKPKLQKAKAKFFANYYSNPAKDLKIIAVTGAGRDTVAHYLQNAIKSKDEHVGLILNPLSTSKFYKQLFAIWKTGANYAVVAISGTNLAHHFFYGLPIHLAVLTDDDSQKPPTIIGDSNLEEEGKAILFNTRPNYSIINHDSANFDLFSKYPSATATFSYGRNRGSDLRINRSKLYKVGTEANLTYGTENFDVATYITSETAVSYMAAAALAAITLGLNTDQIVDAIADYEPKKAKI